MHRTLPAAQVPFLLEPFGINRLDGKCLDGVTMMPLEEWKDDGVKCDLSRYLCMFIRILLLSGEVVVALRAEEKIKIKYSELDSCYSFTPIAIETSGVIGTESMLFSMKLIMGFNKFLRVVWHFHISFSGCQYMYIAVQRGNALTVVETTAGDDSHKL